MSKRFLAYIIPIVIISSNVLAISTEELLELRLAKAELAEIDGSDDIALKIISENINSKIFHIESYNFLAKYYLKRKKFHQAVEVYTSTIIQKHGDYYINANLDEKSVKLAVQNSPIPSEDALNLYFNLAILLTDIEKDKNNTFRKDILAKQYKKYFQVCFFNYHKILETTSYLKRIYNNNNKLLKNLITLRNDLKLDKTKKKDKEQEINFTIGNLLASQNQFTGAATFLKSVYFSKNVSHSLKQYAKNYLDQFYSSEFSVLLNYSVASSSNIHSLTEEQVNNFDTTVGYQARYGKVKGAYNYKSIDLIKRKRFAKYLASTFYSGIQLSEAINKDRALADFKYYYGGANLTFNNLLKSSLSFSFLHTIYQTKASREEGFSRYYYSNNISSRYNHNLSKGILSYNLSLTTTNRGDIKADKRSISTTFSPYIINRYLKPTYNMGIATDESLILGVDKSLVFILSVSNQTIVSDKGRFFTGISIMNNRNKNDSYQYTNTSITATYSYNFYSLIKGLSSNISSSFSNKKYSDNSKVKNLETSIGITYSI